MGKNWTRNNGDDVAPLKLLFISAAFPPMRAGEADHAYHLCRHLAKRGVEVHVLTTKIVGRTMIPLRSIR